MHINKTRLALIAIILAMLACNAPSSEQVNTALTAAAETVTAEAAQLPNQPPASVEPVSSSTPLPSATPCTPTFTTTINANVRSGPSTDYDIVGAIPHGGSAPIVGRNDAYTWWFIEFAGGIGGHAWVAQSTGNAVCLPSVIQVVAAPPTPRPASGTCKPGYVYRKARSSDKVCVLPASKTQADTDNDAAASRLCTATYGPDTCAQGYVWRDAFSGDHVCVDTATRSQAAADNAAAASRVDPIDHTYGPDTCISGYVWREANSSDHVCVTVDIRTQTSSDNAAAASRLCTATYGPDTCAQGYVWRGAWSNDHVCVTPAIRDQTAAENADAPNHTWP